MSSRAVRSVIWLEGGKVYLISSPADSLCLRSRRALTPRPFASAKILTSPRGILAEPADSYLESCEPISMLAASVSKLGKAGELAVSLQLEW